jgi:hypothetical protein
MLFSVKCISELMHSDRAGETSCLRQEKYTADCLRQRLLRAGPRQIQRHVELIRCLGRRRRRVSCKPSSHIRKVRISMIDQVQSYVRKQPRSSRERLGIFCNLYEKEPWKSPALIAKVQATWYKADRKRTQSIAIQYKHTTFRLRLYFFVVLSCLALAA